MHSFSFRHLLLETIFGSSGLVPQAAVKGAEPFAPNEYKVTMLRGLVEEALLALA